jgi:DNA-binding NarL/FixJ family response regulator
MSDDPRPERPLRVLIVDDHEVVRQGLVALLSRRDGFEVVAEGGTVAEALAAARRFQPDLAVLDVRLPDGSGIEACREIRSEMPETKVVMLTSYPDEEAVLAAIVAGASGYLLKSATSAELVQAVLRVVAGEPVFSPSLAALVLGEFRRISAGTQAEPGLTARETEVLKLVAKGYTYKEIADKLFLSTKTVQNHVQNILTKLRLRKRYELMRYAIQRGLDRAPE